MKTKVIYVRIGSHGIEASLTKPKHEAGLWTKYVLSSYARECIDEAKRSAAADALVAPLHPSHGPYIEPDKDREYMKRVNDELADRLQRINQRGSK